MTDLQALIWAVAVLGEYLREWREKNKLTLMRENASPGNYYFVADENKLIRTEIACYQKVAGTPELIVHEQEVVEQYEDFDPKNITRGPRTFSRKATVTESVLKEIVDDA